MPKWGKGGMILFRCQLLCTKRILEGGERKEKFSGSLLESWQHVYKKHIFVPHAQFRYVFIVKRIQI
jgi:hypothetical protein